jgi:hypothetical protein
MPITLYRIVKGSRVVVDDFLPNKERGLPAPSAPDLARLWDGISCYSTVAQARRSAIKRPQLGRFIAELELPDGNEVRVERTLASAGHHTVWAEPSFLLTCVVRVQSV